MVTEYPDVCRPRRSVLSISFILVWNLGTVVVCVVWLIYHFIEKTLCQVTYRLKSESTSSMMKLFAWQSNQNPYAL